MCIFCDDIKDEDILISNEHFFVVYDIDPIQKGHILIISKAHIMNYSELTDKQILSLSKLEKDIINIIENKLSIPGVTVVRNNDKVMDEGVHFHEHIIPRYYDDAFWDNIDVKEREFDFEKFEDYINKSSNAIN